MASNFLTEDDFVFQSDNDLLKDKANAITNHASLVLLDFSDEDITALDEIENKYNSVKSLLFANSNKILQCNKDNVELYGLHEKQRELMSEWKSFELTEGFFHRIFQIERGLLNTNLTAIQRERLELLNTILNEQIQLVLAFNVSYRKTPQVIIDVADFM